ECPDWSDARIGEICSLSPKTIAALRSTSAPGVAAAAGQLRKPRHRLGRDNKLHPVDRAVTGARVVEALERFPGASLRVVATQAGVSPETVRTVRRSLTGQEAESRQSSSPFPTINPDLLGNDTGAKCWSHDSALVSTPEGVRFAAWFDAHAIDETALWEHTRSVPVSRLYEVVDEARRRAR